MGLGGDRRGGVAIVFGAMFPVLVGLAALVVDIASLRLNQTQLQIATDAAALASAARIADLATARATALTLAQANAPAGTTGITAAADVQFGIFDTATKTFRPTSTAPNAVRVQAYRDAAHGNSVATVFAHALGLAGTTALKAESIALAGADACLHVMDPTAAGALQFTGGVSVSASCGFQVNSTSGAALTTTGLFSVSTRSICLVGGYTSVLALGTYNPRPRTGCPARPDPLADVPEPAALNTCLNVNTFLLFGGTLNPGCYTGAVTLGGTVRLNPGVYQFQNAAVSVLLAAQLLGDGVTLYFDRSSTFTMASLSALTLAAPKSGPTQGILFFVSRAATNTTLNLIGGSALSLNGTVYAPTANVTLTGLGAIATRYGTFVVNRLALTGLATMTFNAFPSDARQPSALGGRSVLLQ